MNGVTIKEKLLISGYKLSDLASKMGITPQNLQKLLSVDDIKTGVLEKIAMAIDKDIFFFFDKQETPDKKTEEIKVMNEITNNMRLLSYLYQRIVDVAVLNTDILEITQKMETDMAAEIRNKTLNLRSEVLSNKDGKGEIRVINWETFDLNERKLYNAELGESVRLLQEIFFEQFKLLYKKMRGLKE